MAKTKKASISKTTKGNIIFFVLILFSLSWASYAIIDYMSLGHDESKAGMNSGTYDKFTMIPGDGGITLLEYVIIYTASPAISVLMILDLVKREGWMNDNSKSNFDK